MGVPNIGQIRLTINQVEQLTGVRKSTLRYWEKSFSEFLRVNRSTGNQRQYSERDIEKVLKLRNLLRDEHYTIEGARRRLKLVGEFGDSDERRLERAGKEQD